jgi:hypothetical protein
LSNRESLRHSKVHLAVALCVFVLGIMGCQVVLGLEDHELGDLDAATASMGGAGSQSNAVGGQSNGTSTGGDSNCVVCPVKTALVHRYSFDGTGSQARDSVGSADGTVVGAQLAGDGTVVLSGSGQYVDLPNGIVSSLTNATFEAWITWNGGEPWQRIFDFGSSDSANEGVQGTGVTYLFLTPEDGATNKLRAIYSTRGQSNETRLTGSLRLTTGRMVQVALVFDAAAHTVSLYVNGASAGSGSNNGSLSGLNDINNWLGHSQFAADADFTGTFHEFRIYDAALTAEQLQLTNSLGPDASF